MAPTRVIQSPEEAGRSEHFRVRIEGFGVGTWDLDLRTLDWEWSDTARLLFGVPAGQNVTYPFFLSVLPSSDRTAFELAVADAREHGTALDMSFLVAGNAGQRQG